jgi:hypothetical protein
VQNTDNENIDVAEKASDSENVDSVEIQDSIDGVLLNSINDKTFEQCSSAGNIYSEEELNENLQELNG